MRRAGAFDQRDRQGGKLLRDDGKAHHRPSGAPYYFLISMRTMRAFHQESYFSLAAAFSTLIGLNFSLNLSAVRTSVLAEI